MSNGAVLVIVGVWLIAQTTRGHMLSRLGVIS